MEDVSKIAAVGNEHVPGKLMLEGILITAKGVVLGNGAVKGWPVLRWKALLAWIVYALNLVD